MLPLSAAVLLSATIAVGEAGAPVARENAQAAATTSVGAASTQNLEQAKDAAGTALDGNRPSESAVDGRNGSVKPTPPLSSVPARTDLKADVPTPPAGEASSKRAPDSLLFAGTAVLGALQGGMSAGVVGALAGAGVGLAAAWLFSRKDYGGAFGVTAGAILGTAVAGPLGGLVGAAVGGLIGHFLGKLLL